MVNNYTIGLNETRLGISAPFFFQSAFQNVLPKREAEKALTLGTMFTTEEALKVKKNILIFKFKVRKEILFSFVVYRLDSLMRLLSTKPTQLKNVRTFCSSSRKCQLWLVPSPNKVYVKRTWKSWKIIANKTYNCFFSLSINRSCRKDWVRTYKA